MIRETRIKEYEVADFEGLTESEREVCVAKYAAINVEHDWWWAIHNDALSIGLQITDFDNNGRYAHGVFVLPAERVASLILDSHGESTRTYEAAKAYLEEYALLALKRLRFKEALLLDYLLSLNAEYKYQLSDGAIRETLVNNGYVFNIETMEIV